MSGWSPDAGPRRLAVVAGGDNVPPPADGLDRREPSVAARCDGCERPLATVATPELGTAPGERVYRCRRCGAPNVFYSAAWLSVDERGTP